MTEELQGMGFYSVKNAWRKFVHTLVLRATALCTLSWVRATAAMGIATKIRTRAKFVVKCSV